MRRFDAVVFDMDGVLIDTEPTWRAVEIEAFASVGLQLTEEQCRQTMGVRIEEVVEIWHRRHPWQEPAPAELAERIVAGVISAVEEQGSAKAGAVEAMRRVRDAGLRLGIASSSSRSLIDAVVARLGVAAMVDAIASAEEVDRGKPAPDVYLAAAQRLDVPPRRCLAVEDSPNGVLSAKAAGMHCLAVPDPDFRDDPRMAAADWTMGSLAGFSLEAMPPH